MKVRNFKIAVPDGATLSAVLVRPVQPIVCFVFAHGAGAGMDHAFMQAIAEGLSTVKVATLRFQFPYMERRSKRPDQPAVAHAAVRAAVALAGRKMPKVPLIAGGKSFGGRMTSQAQAEEALPRVVGLAFFGFPWYSAHAPSLTRGEHLHAIGIPMLFMQGARDALGEPKFVKARVRKLGHATLDIVAAADHGFNVPVRSGQTATGVHSQLVTTFAEWAAGILDNGQRNRK